MSRTRRRWKGINDTTKLCLNNQMMFTGPWDLSGSAEYVDKWK